MSRLVMQLKLATEVSDTEESGQRGEEGEGGGN